MREPETFHSEFKWQHLDKRPIYRGRGKANPVADALTLATLNPLEIGLASVKLVQDYLKTTGD